MYGARVVIPKTEAKIRALQTQLEVIQYDYELGNDHAEEEHQLTMALLQKRISELEKDRALRTRNATRAHHRIEGETIGKYWSSLSKERKPRDIIHSLEKTADADPLRPAQPHAQTKWLNLHVGMMPYNAMPVRRTMTSRT